MAKKIETVQTRGSGILLHVSSLPSPYGIGDFGSDAYRFVDFLAETKQQYWQILPLNPTGTILGNSPYSSVSAFAGNCLFLNPELLVQDGLLQKSDIDHHFNFSKDRVQYEEVTEYKNKLLSLAFERNKDRIEKDKNFHNFCKLNSYWLDDYSFFIVAKDVLKGAVWCDWPVELRDRKLSAIKEWNDKYHEQITKEKFFQYLFYNQWFSLKNYCNSKKIKIVGDIPIYVSYDSCDVWSNPGIFKLDKDKKPTHVAGVPPDFFSETGQLWGNPVYRWDALKKEQYGWWLGRFEHNLILLDVVRIDHFRGFVGYWEVPAHEKTAIKGKWVKAPAQDFFTVLLKRFPKIPVIAEDLGVITDDVRHIMREFNFLGMKLLIFAFDEAPARNPYMPHNHHKHCIVYTGTHDNNTIRGWFEKEARPIDRNRVYRYFGREISFNEIAWEFTKLAMMSVADIVILPIQDVLGLGEEGRMNRPATVGDNWRWRLSPEMLSPWIASRLKEITEIYGRS